MALINEAKREINAKIVFFGPGFSGKGTNLRFAYNKLKPEFRGNLKALDVDGGKMLFFDFNPPGDGNVLGYRVRLHVYTISGANVDPGSWKTVLKGVDGIAFIADAASSQVAVNCQSLEQLSDALKDYGLRVASKPVVFQYNKTDQPDALSKEELDRVLNPSALPSFMASSKDGTGVLQTLLALVKAVLLDLRNKGVDGLTEAERLMEGAETSAPTQGATAAPFAAASTGAEVQPGSHATLTESQQLEEPLTVELSAAVEVAGSGKISLPLTIRSGARTKSVTLNLSFTLEER